MINCGKLNIQVAAGVRIRLPIQHALSKLRSSVTAEAESCNGMSVSFISI